MGDGNLPAWEPQSHNKEDARDNSSNCVHCCPFTVVGDCSIIQDVLQSASLSAVCVDGLWHSSIPARERAPIPEMADVCLLRYHGSHTVPSK